MTYYVRSLKYQNVRHYFFNWTYILGKAYLIDVILVCKMQINYTRLKLSIIYLAEKKTLKKTPKDLIFTKTIVKLLVYLILRISLLIQF